MTKLRVAAVAAALALAAPVSALAYDAPHRGTWTGYEVETTGSIGAPLAGSYGRNPATCAVSSAAEGNANQQNFPTKQYGQTAGGNRC